MNFYPFHIGDYISHTNHLTDEEDLAYRRMIDLYYQSEQPFNDSSTVARRIRASVEVVDAILGEFFTFEDDNCWHNKRIDEEIGRYHGRLEQASRAGKASAEARFNKRSTTVQPTKNQEPLTKNHINITPDGFDLFWIAYDKKVGKPNAIKEWKKIKPDAELVKVIVNQAKKDKVAKPDNKYRKDPERWLKGGHWQDELIVEHVAEQKKDLPLGTDAQIEHAYKVECGGDPSKARFGSYNEMRKFIQEFRDKSRKALQ
jgi:uncharacterized protein YdaU (DUF1376 family)